MVTGIIATHEVLTPVEPPFNLSPLNILCNIKYIIKGEDEVIILTAGLGEKKKEISELVVDKSNR